MPNQCSYFQRTASELLLAVGVFVANSSMLRAEAQQSLLSDQIDFSAESEFVVLVHAPDDAGQETLAGSPDVRILASNWQIQRAAVKAKVGLGHRFKRRFDAAENLWKFADLHAILRGSKSGVSEFPDVHQVRFASKVGRTFSGAKSPAGMSCDTEYCDFTAVFAFHGLTHAQRFKDKEIATLCINGIDPFQSQRQEIPVELASKLGVKTIAREDLGTEIGAITICYRIYADAKTVAPHKIRGHYLVDVPVKDGPAVAKLLKEAGIPYEGSHSQFDACQLPPMLSCSAYTLDERVGAGPLLFEVQP